VRHVETRLVYVKEYQMKALSYIYHIRYSVYSIEVFEREIERRGEQREKKKLKKINL
jgi:hypothetical protein